MNKITKQKQQVRENLYFDDGVTYTSLPRLISMLQDAYDTHKDKYSDIYFVEEDVPYSNGEKRLSLIGHRLETDAECTARMATQKYYEQLNEQREKEQYAALKAKYENKV